VGDDPALSIMRAVFEILRYIDAHLRPAAEPGEGVLPSDVDVAAVQREDARHGDKASSEARHAVVRVYQVIAALPGPAPHPKRGKHIVQLAALLPDHLDVDVRPEPPQRLDLFLDEDPPKAVPDRP